MLLSSFTFYWYLFRTSSCWTSTFSFFLDFLGGVFSLWWIVSGSIYWLVVSRLFRVGAAVLYLRKFRSRDSEFAKFTEAVETACIDVAVPFTVQDGSFDLRPSFWVRMTELWSMIPLMIVLIIFSTYVTFEIEGRIDGQIPELVKYAFFGGMCYLGAKYIGPLFRRSVFRIEKNDSAQLVRRIDSVRMLKSGYRGIESFACQDDDWREFISQALEKVDAVVIDVTQPTEALLWEIREALSRKGEDSIVLTAASENGSVPDHISTLLADEVPPWLLEECLVYSSKQEDVLAYISLYTRLAALIQPSVGLIEARWELYYWLPVLLFVGTIAGTIGFFTMRYSALL